MRALLCRVPPPKVGVQCPLREKASCRRQYSCVRKTRFVVGLIVTHRWFLQVLSFRCRWWWRRRRFLSNTRAASDGVPRHHHHLEIRMQCSWRTIGANSVESSGDSKSSASLFASVPRSVRRSKAQRSSSNVLQCDASFCGRRRSASCRFCVTV